MEALAVHEEGLVAGGDFLSAGGAAWPFVSRWSRPLPGITPSQAGGPETGVSLTNWALQPGREYYNLVSTDPCPGGVGSDAYGGLCFSDPRILVSQIQLPAGSPPFHFVSSGVTGLFGPYPLPWGLTLEVLCVDVTGGVLGCISPVIRYTVL